MVFDFPWTEEERSKYVDMYVDTDWGADEIARKSTSAGALMRGTEKNAVTLTFYSVTQATPSLSSGEAEFKGITKGLIEALFMKNFAERFGDKVTIRIHSDSTAALGMCRRLGTGKRVKHIEIPYFFIQQVVNEGQVVLCKVATEVNPADIGTKYLSGTRLKELLQLMNCKTMPAG